LSFGYNDRGRMMATSGASTSYLYNALGQMIEKSGTLGTTLFVQDEAGHLIGEYDGSGNLIEETVWLGDIPVATLQPNGSGGVNIFYVHTDHLNTPKKISRPSDNQLVWRWDADPFGTASDNQNPSGLGTFSYNLRFPGQYYMAETGLNQNYFRDYDPLTGKYVESDPIGLAAGVNTYTYVRSNPISNGDPSGLLSPVEEWAAAQSLGPRPLQVVRGTPANACTCRTSSGTPFSIPPGVNFSAVQAAGRSAGFNPFAVNAAVGHFGNFDFQRNAANNTFTGAYADASNYAVGVYMQGAGYSLGSTVAIAQSFSYSMSSNPGDPRQQEFWKAGWMDANAGLLAGGCQ
jgi:RHS repeat-associated protein